MPHFFSLLFMKLMHCTAMGYNMSLLLVVKRYYCESMQPCVYVTHQLALCCSVFHNLMATLVVDFVIIRVNGYKKDPGACRFTQ